MADYMAGNFPMQNLMSALVIYVRHQLSGRDKADNTRR